MMISTSRLGSRAAAFVAAIFVFAGVSSAQDVSVNDKPLRDFAKDVQAKIDRKDLDVSKPFSVEMSAVITDDGKLDKNASKFIAESGDPKMVAVAKQAIWAMGESGYFGYAGKLGIERANISLSQDGSTAVTAIRSPQNAFKARMMASMVGIALSVGKSQAKTDTERMILENTTASAGDGTLDIVCSLPSSEFQRMILGKTAAAAPVN